MYEFDGHPIWRRLDIAFSYIHIVVPLMVHLICSIHVLSTIARRKIFIRGTKQKFCYVWFEQLYIHRDFFIPPTSIILCILPHGILGHLLKTCIPYSDKFRLRIHIIFIILLFVPQMLSFMLYVYPNERYWKEFQQIFIYRKLCHYFHQKEQKLRQKVYSIQAKNMANVNRHYYTN